MTVLTEAEVATERVANGARWLDENFPGWEERINPRTLRLDEGSKCICGQLFKEVAKRAGEDDGYGYAWSTLFTEANSWITAIVGIRPLGQGRRLTYDEKERRAERVGVALGFSSGTVEGRAGASNHVDVEFPALQDAWKALIKERTAEKVPA